MFEWEKERTFAGGSSGSSVEEEREWRLKGCVD